MIRESYVVTDGTAYDIEIAPASKDGLKYPVVVVIHGNLGLVTPFGQELRKFTKEIASLGYLAALPSYYNRGRSNPLDTHVASHVPSLTAAVQHLAARSDADDSRLGLVGFSLGGGIAAAYINGSPYGRVKVFASFYGLVAGELSAGVRKFPPTIIFHNAPDEIVPAATNSEPFARALDDAGITYEPTERPFPWYRDDWKLGLRHAFRPGGHADTDSRAKTLAWLTSHMPPVGKS